MKDRAQPAGFRVLACPAGGTAAALVLVVEGSFGEPDCELADRVESLLPAGAHVVVDVSRVGPPDVGTVAALARLQLRLRVGGGSIRLRGASPALRAVVGLLGFEAVLPAEESGRS